MDELAKTEARNYLCAAGFFMFAAAFILSLIRYANAPQLAGESTSNVALFLGIALLVVATLLIVLHKRDMIAILFFLMGFIAIYYKLNTYDLWWDILLGFILLVALVTLTGQDKKKWMLFIIPLIWFIYLLISEVVYNQYVFITFQVLFVVISLYYAFCCACERISLPGAKTLTADESTDFKASGSVLGYMLFALIAGGYALHYILGEAALPLATFQTIELIAGSLMVFVAILLLAVGKMRFTPVMFLLLGLTNILMVYSSGAMYFGIGILWLVIGLFCILRKESRILPGIMLIVYAGTALFSAYATGVSISAPVVSAILNAIPCLIAIYLSFVVYSQRKLPKF